MTTGIEMCELIAKMLKETRGVDIAPEAIWYADANGELAHVFELYWQARFYYAMPTHDRLPVTAHPGDMALVIEDDAISSYMWFDGWKRGQTKKL